MKIGIIGFNNIRYMPYIKKYVDILNNNNVEFDVIYWERDELPDIFLEANCIKFKKNSSMDKYKIFKILDFISFRSKVKKLIQEKGYDKLIVLTTIPAVLLYSLLIKKYPNKFIFDYRDVTYENIWLYRNLVNDLAKHSFITTLSSKGFLANLSSSNKYIYSHNFTTDAIEHIGLRSNFPRKKKIIKIRFFGMIRQAMFNCRIIDCFANDIRFEIYYHGHISRESLFIQDYCQQKGHKNVFFIGGYLPEERFGFLKDTDIIHNIYDNDKIMSLATSNKVYDGCILSIPQLVNKGSHIDHLLEEYGIGLAVDPNDPLLADAVYKYYNSLNWQQFEKQCSLFFNEILSEDKLFQDKITQFIQI